MRTRLSVALAAACLLLIPAAPAVAARADDPDAPVVRSIALSQSSVTVSGLQTVLVTVTARLTDQTGVDAGPKYDGIGLSYWTPAIWFGPDPAFLQLASGTPQDGIWTGQMPVTSRWSGTYPPTSMVLEDTANNESRIDPTTVISTPSISVQSSHRPAVKMSFSPDPATPGTSVTQYISVTDSETGAPVSYAPLRLAFDNQCVESTGEPARTGLFGTYQRVLTGAESTPGGYCAWVAGDDSFRNVEYPTKIAAVNRSIRFRYVVTAAPARTWVPAGTNVKVTGTAKPGAGYKTLQLQRLSGGTWVTVNTTTVDPNGRYTVLATPPRRATFSYRVHAPADDNAAGTSATFTIRGT